MYTWKPTVLQSCFVLVNLCKLVQCFLFSCASRWFIDPCPISKSLEVLAIRPLALKRPQKGCTRAGRLLQSGPAGRWWLDWWFFWFVFFLLKTSENETQQTSISFSLHTRTVASLFRSFSSKPLREKSSNCDVLTILETLGDVHQHSWHP